MKDRIKIGNRISCVIDLAIKNYLIVSYKTAGTCYRGVLINESDSTARRKIPENFFPKKAVLSQETTDNLLNAITNRDLDTTSKATRSKKLKQSCIVLDEYDLTSDSKSPIDSIRGLVESIDNIKDISLLPHPVVNKDNQKANFESKWLKRRTETKTKPVRYGVKTSPYRSEPKLLTVRKDCKEFNRPVKLISSHAEGDENNPKTLKKPVSFHFINAIPEIHEKPAEISIPSSPQELSPSVKKVEQTAPVSNALMEAMKRKRMENIRRRAIRIKLASQAKKRSLQEDDKESVDSPTSEEPTVKKVTRLQTRSTEAIIPSVKETITQYEKLISRKNKQKSQSAVLATKKRVAQRRKILNARKAKFEVENKVRTPSVSPIANKTFDKSDEKLSDASPSSKVKQTKVDPAKKLFVKRKRIDPLVLALNNIRKYDSVRKRRGRNLKSTFNLDDDVPRRKRKKRLAALKSMSFVKTLGESRRGDGKVVHETKLRKAERVVEKHSCVKQKRKSKPKALLPSELKVFGKKEESVASDTNGEFDEIETLQVATQEIEPRHREVEQPFLDLLCYENSLSPDTKIVSLPRVKNRRKPVKVFKSLPNLSEEHKDLTAVEMGKQQPSDALDKSEDAVINEERKTDSLSLPKRNLFKLRPRLLPGNLPVRRVSSVFEVEEEVDDDVIDAASDDGISGRTSPTDSVLSESKLNTESDSESKRIKDECSVKPVKKGIYHEILRAQEKLKPLTRSKDEIRTGDVVWGRCHGYGWWPGIVKSLDSNKLMRFAHVSWLNSNTQSYITCKDLDLFVPHFTKHFKRKSSKSIRTAVIEAQRFCEEKYGSISE